MTDGSEAVRVLRDGAGETTPDAGGVRDRSLLDSRDTERRFACVQHLFPPRALAAPMHRHHEEDEYTYVLYGRIGVVLGGRKSSGVRATSSSRGASGTRSGSPATSLPLCWSSSRTQVWRSCAGHGGCTALRRRAGRPGAGVLLRPRLRGHAAADGAARSLPLRSRSPSSQAHSRSVAGCSLARPRPGSGADRSPRPGRAGATRRGLGGLREAHRASGLRPAVVRRPSGRLGVDRSASRTRWCLPGQSRCGGGKTVGRSPPG